MKAVILYIAAALTAGASLAGSSRRTSADPSLTGPSLGTFADPSLADLKAAVEAHPDSVSYHEKYIAAFEKSMPGRSRLHYDSVLDLLQQQYDAWMERFPTVAAVPYAIGDVYVKSESPKARPFLQKAVALDPHMAKAWADLAGDAGMWGNDKETLDYYKKAMDAEPASIEYAVDYVWAIRSQTPDRFPEAANDFIARFPKDERSCQLLYWLAEDNEDENVRISLYERLRTGYSPEKYEWSDYGMQSYFALLLIKDPAKALGLAQSMATMKLEDKEEWDKLVKMAEKVYGASKASPAEAVAQLADVKVPSYWHSIVSFQLFKAGLVAASAGPGAAYDSLLAFYAKRPNKPVWQAMLGYGLKSGKDSLTVDADVQNLRVAQSKPASPFTLYAYQTKDSSSLVDYHGKVVLLTFWFPGCGPCRREFPHFQNVMTKFKGQDVSYVGINVVSDQDPFVVPLLASKQFGFTPLKDNEAAKAYHAWGCPTNFVIDRQGRIVFSDFMIDDKQGEEMVESMIGSLLAQDDSLATLRAAVEANPDSLSYHERFIAAFRKNVPGANYNNYDSVMNLLVPQYNEWIARFPNSAVVPFALGHAFANAESPRAKPFLLTAVAQNPQLAEAWMDLSIDAERWGDFQASRDYLKKAVDAAPNNPDYAFYYAASFEASDPAEDRRLSLEVVRRFPNSERGAQALYWMAFNTPDEKGKIAIYEELKQKFPPANFNWSASGMSEYFDILLTKEPAKALALAKEMWTIPMDDYEKKMWEANLPAAEKFVLAEKAFKAGRPSDASSILDAIHLSKYSDAREAVGMFKAKAVAAAGHTRAAYDSLLVFYVKAPSDELHEEMVKLAGKMGKDAAWVDQVVRDRRAASAVQAPAFNLYAYLKGDSVSLESYKGKVVLMTFWFPGCGPCRGEFPHFQQVVDKFKGKDLAYVGINVFKDQAPYVASFMRSSGYSFSPLADNDDAVMKAYHVRGCPTNFLIDKDGKIVFTDFTIRTPKTERMLELMIQSLL